MIRHIVVFGFFAVAGASHADSSIRLTYSNPGGVTVKLIGGDFVAVTVMDQSGVEPTRSSGGEFKVEPPMEEVIEDIIESSDVGNWLSY